MLVVEDIDGESSYENLSEGTVVSPHERYMKLIESDSHLDLEPRSNWRYLGSLHTVIWVYLETLCDDPQSLSYGTRVIGSLNR